MLTQLRGKAGRRECHQEKGQRMSAVPDYGAQERTEIGDTDNSHPSSFLLTGSSNGESLNSCFPAAKSHEMPF